MKLIDVLVMMHNKRIPQNFKFTLDDDRYVYFVKHDFLYSQKYDYEPIAVEWHIYQKWLDKDVKVLGDEK